MTATTISIAGLTFNCSALLITFGIIVWFVLAMVLYGTKNHHVYPIIIFAPLAFIFAVLIGRVTHWYFNSESYASFLKAFTEFDVGSFTLPGALIGIWLGAFLTQKIHACDDRWAVLDAAAPGMIFALMCIRLSAWFNTSCRGRINISTKLFQILPFAVSSTDNAGNVTYKFATFFFEAVLLLILFIITCGFYRNHIHDKMVKTCNPNGNVAKFAFVAYNGIEIIMDSTRYDSPLMRFKFISYLNQYSAFISFAQVFAAFVMLYVLLYYSIKGIKAKGFKWYYPLVWLGFLAGVFLIGFLGEYKVQRTAMYLRCYSFMLVGIIMLYVMIYIVYRRCVKESRKYEKEEYDDEYDEDDDEEYDDEYDEE